MTRIAPLEPPFDQATAELLGKMMPPGVDAEPLAIFRTLARLPKLGKRLAAVGGALLTSTSLPLPLRELAILRTTARLGAEYESGVHVTWLATAAGIDPRQVADTRAPSPNESLWSAEQLAILRAVDTLCDTATLDDDTFDAVTHHLSRDATLELVTVVGFYHLISFVVRAADLPAEIWADRFPAPAR